MSPPSIYRNLLPALGVSSSSSPSSISIFKTVSISLLIVILNTISITNTVTQVSAIHVRAWVNPLMYPRKDLETDEVIISVFSNMDDAETGQQAQEAMLYQAETEKKWRKVLTDNRRRFLIGSSDCNTSEHITEFLPHAERMIEQGVQMTKTFLNIGAQDGRTEDPVYSYVEKHQAKGIYFEKDQEYCRMADQNLNLTQRIICAGVTPNNLMDLLIRYGGQGIKNGMRHFDLIKIDIDSYDSVLLNILLENHFSAKMFFLEVNPAIPPPYKFATGYHPKLFDVMINSSMQDWPLRGMSLSYAIGVMAKYGYDFLHFGYHDAVFVNRAYRHVYQFTPPHDEFDCYHKAFIMSNGVPIKLTRKWFYETTPEQGVAEIFQHMVSHSMNATRGEIAFPFGLSY